MKKLLALLFCLLPLSAWAETPVLLTETPVAFTHQPERISNYLLLPDNVLLINYHTQRTEDSLELAEAISPDGSSLWSVPLYSYETDHYPKERVLARDADAVTTFLYDQIRDGETCKRITTRFSLSGEIIEPATLDSFPSAEAVKTWHAGDFRADRCFGDYEDLMVPTVLTHFPTGHTCSLELPGQGSFHALGDRLLYLYTDADGTARLWAFDASLTMLMENTPVDLGSEHASVVLSVQDGELLYLFAQTGRSADKGREYTVFPFDQALNRQEALCVFSLGVIESDDFLTDYSLSLSQAIPCGDGFLLLAHHPWQWGKIMQHDLYYLSRTGGVRLLDSFAQDDMPILIPGGLLLSRTETSYVIRSWGMDN